MQTKDDLIINIQIKKLRATYISAEIDKKASTASYLKQIKAHAVFSAKRTNSEIKQSIYDMKYCVQSTIYIILRYLHILTSAEPSK